MNMYLLISLLSSAYCQNYYYQCGPNQSFCIYGGPSSDGKTVITVHSSAKGWFGFGVGKSMTSATMFVTWKNTTNGYSVLEGGSKAYSMPTPYTHQFGKVIPLQVKAPSWATMAYSISIPAVPSNDFIMASSDDKPVFMIGSSSPRYGIHSIRHSFQANFKQLMSGVPVNTDSLIKPTDTDDEDDESKGPKKTSSAYPSIRLKLSGLLSLGMVFLCHFC